MENEKMQVVILTGLSGSGKTNAVDWFEDSGYYCVDNMPPAFIGNFIDIAKTSTKEINKAAFVVDIRGGAFFNDLKGCIKELKMRDDIDCSILFIEASDRTLVKRFNETRRNHPLATGTTSRDVIEQEREMLKPIREIADHIIDTTNLKVAGLKLEIGRIFEGGESSFAINIKSFGFKRGLLQEADLIFDMRFIPNPYYVASLKKLTGNNKKVSSYVFRQPISNQFLDSLLKMLDEIIPAYRKEGKYHLNIAFGCTGGQHRSVAMADRVSEEMKAKGYRVTLEHRDI